MKTKKEYFLFGEAITNVYENEGIDKVLQLVKNEDESAYIPAYAIFEFDPDYHSGCDILAMYDGWMGFVNITKAEFDQITNTEFTKPIKS